MGYYIGSGVVTSGGQTVALRATGPAYGGPYYTYTRTTTTVTTLMGVSLTTAQAAGADMSLTYWQWPGGGVESASRGSRYYATYSQINGSNLYQLQKTSEKIDVRGLQGTYDSGWQT